MAKLFSDREIRAIPVFLPLAGLLIIALMLVRPAADPEAARRAEAEMEEALPADSVVMSHFDPNTASLDDLRRLGLTKHEAVSLLKYRAAGKVFRIPEDLTLCYGISDSLYRRLEPWVRIGRKYAIAPEKYRTGRILPEPLAPGPFRIDTVSARYLRAIGALSKRQAEAFIRWRDLSGIYDMEDLRECYGRERLGGRGAGTLRHLPGTEGAADRTARGAEHGRFGDAALGCGHRSQDRRGDHALPRTARRIRPRGATRRGSGSAGTQL